MSEAIFSEPTDGAFAQRFGTLLRTVRKERGMRIRHLADHAIPARSLRAAEAGTLVLEPVTITELAMRYGVELGRVMAVRNPVHLDAHGTLHLADRTVHLRDREPATVLGAYLSLVREIRNLDDDDLVALRRQDVDELAGHLDVPPRSVIEGLGSLMGASDEQTRAMIGLYLSHASVIGCVSAN